MKYTLPAIAGRGPCNYRAFARYGGGGLAPRRMGRRLGTGVRRLSRPAALLSGLFLPVPLPVPLLRQLRLRVPGPMVAASLPLLRLKSRGAFPSGSRSGREGRLKSRRNGP